MLRSAAQSPAITGALCAMAATLFFSVNDVGVKALAGDYALHQVILIRSVFGLIVILALIAPLTGGRGILRTRRLPMHILRGFCVVLANMAFFLGLAEMPLAEAVAIFFVSPLILTIFSVVFLRETVGPWRWAAIGIGLLGVIVMMRPGTAAFQAVSLYPLAAAVFYAGLHTITRRIGTTESAVTMAFYIQVVFIVVSVLFGLAIGDGRFAVQDEPSLAFLLRGWVIPAPGDLGLMAVLGLAIAVGGYFISQAYRVAPAAAVAPFEYLALPVSIVWGITVFGEWPDLTAYLGIAMILGSGLFTLWREGRKAAAPPGPRLRR
jgi:drug/metabolite transporter (DMT)-like permease